MASKTTPLLFAFFLLFSSSFARQQQHQLQQQQIRHLCQLQNIEAQESYDVIRAEAGLTEFWDSNSQEFQCAGVDFVRHRIQPGGLFLPSYVNAPVLAFVERGQGVHGVILPGCPETYEDSADEQQFSRERRQKQSLQDRHQKVDNLYEGHVVAIPTGATHWIYNDGNTELVVLVFIDVQNNDNQLDPIYMRFFLAGKPQDQSRQQQGGRRQEQDQSRRGQQGQGHRNIFNGFDIEIIAEAFNVDQETAQKLQGQQDQRGHIVNVGQNLQIIRPRQQQQQQQQHGGSRRHSEGPLNGLEETICSMKLKENIDNPSHQDFTNPEAGQIANLNSFKFPVLEGLQLSVERGVLNENAIQAPHWTINAHNLLYVTDGSMRVQIVNHEGNSVFDNELQQGQVVVIPQNFAVIKRAGQQGCRWISFRTNDNAMISNLAGRVSAIRSMPVDVVANSYQISREEASRLKFSQQESTLFTPNIGRSSGERAVA